MQTRAIKLMLAPMFSQNFTFDINVNTNVNINVGYWLMRSCGPWDAGIMIAGRQQKGVPQQCCLRDSRMVYDDITDIMMAPCQHNRCSTGALLEARVAPCAQSLLIGCSMLHADVQQTGQPLCSCLL